MKIVLTFSLLLVAFEFSFIQAQTENLTSIPNDPKSKVDIPFEKVYLHMDRTYYSSGEDIWFKAYLVDALTNRLSDNSNNLYVELVSPESKIIKRFLLRIEKGTGAGDIHLGDSIASGNYQIRAYTNWMRNFGEVFFFKKEIVIENQMSIRSSGQSMQQDNNEKIDVQFFPEGGPLIDNTSTVLGFKAVNSSGYGCNVKGQVFSSLGDTVIRFASTHLGMGSFNFIPKKGLKYFAAGSAGNGITFRTNLPTSSETGYSLKVYDINNDYFRVTIKTNQETLDEFPVKKMVIVGTSHNSLCITAEVDVKLVDYPINLAKNEFPEGIALITLMDTSGKIYCERVYYVHHQENYHISIVPDNKVYMPRQKVTLQISVRDTLDKPVSANISVSIVDGNQLKGFEKKPDIRSFLLLESEIRGNIEQPFYYFDTTVKDRYVALDNLLLTQGWRNFIWKYLSDTTIRFDYPVEKGICISGRLRRVLIDKPIAGANISLALMGRENPLYKYTQTDSTGKYYFDGMNFIGSQNIVVTASDKKDMNQGRISLDSIYRDPAQVTMTQLNQSERANNNVSSYVDILNRNETANNNEIYNYKEEAVRKYDILNKYHITDTIALGEVEIRDRRPQDENADGHERIYGMPNFSLTVTDELLGTKNVFEAIKGRVPGFNIIGNNRFIMRGQEGTPLFLLDGKEVDLGTISALPMFEVDKIEVIKDGGKLALYGFRGSYGVVNVFTKRGSERLVPKPVLYSINKRVYGYYQERTFYSPRYDVQKSVYEMPDLRTTIHWEPYVFTDKDGDATISFFNADNKSVMRVDVEGITELGIPVTGNVSFDVK